MSHPDEIPQPFANDVSYGRMLVGGRPAVLEWDGQTIRLSLQGTGEPIFDLSPGEITHVRDDQRITVVIRTAAETFHMSFPEASGSPVGLAGTTLRQTHDMALSSPVNDWIGLFRALGIRVHDNTFVPPKPMKAVAWTLGIVFGVVLLVCIVAFVVIFFNT